MNNFFANLFTDPRQATESVTLQVAVSFPRMPSWPQSQSLPVLLATELVFFLFLGAVLIHPTSVSRFDT